MALDQGVSDFLYDEEFWIHDELVTRGYPNGKVGRERGHLESLRRRVARDWESMDFATLQSAIRELVDRLEVDGDETRLFLHL